MGWPYDDECPDRGTARRRGERDFERGKGSYEDPYRERAREAFDDYEWRQASRAWEDGHRSARYAEEERQEEECQRQRDAEERRVEEQRIEEEQLFYAEQEYEQHCREVDADAEDGATPE